MSEWVTLYIGDAAAAEDLCELLTRGSIRSFQTVERGQIISPTGARETRTRVDVPSDELQSARSIYAEWERPQATRADNLSRRILGVLLISLIPPTLWIGAYYLGVPGLPSPTPAWVLGIWFGSLLVVGQVEDRRTRNETIGRAV